MQEITLSVSITQDDINNCNDLHENWNCVAWAIARALDHKLPGFNWTVWTSREYIRILESPNANRYRFSLGMSAELSRFCYALARGETVFPLDFTLILLG